MSRSRKDQARVHFNRLVEQIHNRPIGQWVPLGWAYWNWFFCGPPADFRRIVNRQRRARAKQAIREGIDPPRERRHIRYDWW